MKEFAGDNAENTAQQFTYDQVSQAIKTRLHSGTGMFEGANMNVITYELIGLDQQKFVYNKDTKVITNSVSGKALSSENLSTETGGYRVGRNIIASELDLNSPA